MTQLVLPTAADTHALGERIGHRLTAGDLVILDGALGAGKTVLTKGIAAGMGVTGIVMSPTFVIARVHRPAAPDGVTLVHVDAYRLGGQLEFDDLDLDTDLTAAAVVVEWGEGRAEQLADDHLLIRLARHADDSRTAEIVGTGRRWAPLAHDLGIGTLAGVAGTVPVTRGDARFPTAEAASSSLGDLSHDRGD